MQRKAFALNHPWLQRRRFRATWLFAVACIALLVVPPADAMHASHEGGDDRFAIFSSVDITEDTPAADVVCAFCSVRVNGDVQGDVATLFSTVDVAPGRTISGDVATLFSTIRLGSGAEIKGDLATALGRAEIAPGARVDGDRAILGSGLGLLVVLGPLLILVGLLWLLVWFARRVFA